MSADLWVALVLAIVSFVFSMASLCRTYYTRGLIDGRAEVMEMVRKHLRDEEVDDG